MNKNIWIYWNSGFENSPEIVKYCKKSWEYYNPSYNINILNDNNIYDFVPNDLFKPKLMAHWSDVLRINLLKLHGGIWVDATVFCNKPLDDWFHEYNKTGFFCFSDPTPKYKMCNWFLYGELGNNIISNLHKGVTEYWDQRSKAHDYYLFHLIYNQMYKETDAIKKYKANWQPLSESGANPHYFAPYTSNRLNNLNGELTAPVYKLRHGSSNILMQNSLIQKLIGNIL